MSIEERSDRLLALNTYVTRHTAAQWGQSFVKELISATKLNEKILRTPALDTQRVLEAYK
jgi:trehalose-6-phosphate synthase